MIHLCLKQMTQKIAQKISQKLSQKNRATTRTIIADMLLLQQMGYLRREGGRKNGRWVVGKRE